MPLPRMDRCFCLRIETLGICIAWLGLTGYGVCVTMLSLFLLISFQFPCDGDRVEKIPSCRYGQSGLIMISLASVIVTSIIFNIFLKLLQGIEEQYHWRVIPAIVVLILQFIATIFGMVLYPLDEVLIIGSLNLVLSVVFVIILYFVFMKLWSENSEAKNLVKC